MLENTPPNCPDDALVRYPKIGTAFIAAGAAVCAVVLGHTAAVPATAFGAVCGVATLGFSAIQAAAHKGNGKGFVRNFFSALFNPKMYVPTGAHPK